MYKIIGLIDTINTNMKCLKCELPYKIDSKILYSENYFIKNEFCEVWKCKICTFNNNMASNYCYMCQNMKDNKLDILYQENEPQIFNKEKNKEMIIHVHICISIIQIDVYIY